MRQADATFMASDVYIQEMKCFKETVNKSDRGIVMTLKEISKQMIEKFEKNLKTLQGDEESLFHYHIY